MTTWESGWGHEYEGLVAPGWNYARSLSWDQVWKRAWSHYVRPPQPYLDDHVTLCETRLQAIRDD